jgi:LmeA-like phospholipid-binding
LRRLIALGVIALVVVLLIVAQLVLPGIAANRVHDELARSGAVLSVKVSAFPAIQLLWGSADRVVIRMGRYRAGASEIGGKLDAAGGVGTLDASAQEFDSGALVVRDARLHKRGSELVGTATITEADLRAAVPFLDNVQPVASADGRLVLRGTASLFGLRASVDVAAAAQNGNLVVAPDVPFGGLATITLFSDPRVEVQSVAAAPVPGGFSIEVRARLR